MIGQGAPPSPCKQGWDSSSCPESKHKYLFLLGVRWQRRWNQDTTQTANKQPPRADGETAETERAAGLVCGCCFVNLPLLAPLLANLCILPPVFFSSFFFSPPPPPPLFGSTFPFRVSSSSCHKEPPFSPERRLPVPHCNPITYLTEECVISTE